MVALFRLDPMNKNWVTFKIWLSVALDIFKRCWAGQVMEWDSIAAERPVTNMA